MLLSDDPKRPGNDEPEDEVCEFHGTFKDVCYGCEENERRVDEWIERKHQHRKDDLPPEAA